MPKATFIELGVYNYDIIAREHGKYFELITMEFLWLIISQLPDLLSFGFSITRKKCKLMKLTTKPKKWAKQSSAAWKYTSGLSAAFYQINTG